MKRHEVRHIKKPAVVLSYRRANLFDVPLIFQLLQEGAEVGAFSDAFVTRMGSAKLLGFVLREVLAQLYPSSKNNFRDEWQIISNTDGVEVGFLKVRNGMGACKESNLILLAISPAHRNNGIGSAVLEHIQSEVQPGGHLYVHSTKYARAMQHILKRHGLKRNVKFHVPHLEEYQSNWSGLS